MKADFLLTTLLLLFSPLRFLEANQYAHRPSRRTQCAEDELCGWLVTKCPYLSTKQGRPVEDQSESVPVSINFSVKRILDLDENNQILKLIGKFVVRWKMPRCAIWNQMALTRIHQSALSFDARLVNDCSFWKKDIWYPKISTTSQYEETGLDSSLTHEVTLHNTGYSETTMPGKYFMQCDFNYRKFPFDFQYCSTDVQSIAKENLVNLTEFEVTLKDKNVPPWELVDYGYDYQVFDDAPKIARVYFMFKRQTSAFSVLVFFAVSCFACLQIAALLIPANLSERPAVSIVTTLLVHLTCQSFIQQNPHINQQQTFIAYYLYGILFLCVLSNVYMIVSFRLAAGARLTDSAIRRSSFKVPKLKCLDMIYGLLFIVLALIMNITYAISVFI